MGPPSSWSAAASPHPAGLRIVSKNPTNFHAVVGARCSHGSVGFGQMGTVSTLRPTPKWLFANGLGWNSSCRHRVGGNGKGGPSPSRQKAKGKRQKAKALQQPTVPRDFLLNRGIAVFLRECLPMGRRISLQLMQRSGATHPCQRPHQ